MPNFSAYSQSMVFVPVALTTIPFKSGNFARIFSFIGQRELIEKFDKGEESLFLLYHTTSSYHNFLKEFIKINQLPTQHHISIDNLSLIEHEVLKGTGITIVSQDTAERLLENSNIISSSKKLKDIFIKTYAIVKMENKHYLDLLTIIQKLKNRKGQTFPYRRVQILQGLWYNRRIENMRLERRRRKLLIALG
ncbi:hypothetical protein [Streptococcus lutetiensis]|nr:hypothetical protein [Streptococcus lutetiensis]